jgi:deferrochelatase/peroxidase EfeB
MNAPTRLTCRCGATYSPADKPKRMSYLYAHGTIYFEDEAMCPACFDREGKRAYREALAYEDPGCGEYPTLDGGYCATLAEAEHRDAFHAGGLGLQAMQEQVKGSR